MATRKAATNTKKVTVKKAAEEPASAKVLVLRTCAANLISYNGFKWPKKGRVEAPDWNPGAHCGNGLHGWLWGEGDGNLGNWGEDAKWLVVETDAATVVDLGGKVKFPSGTVVFCGDRHKAVAYLSERAPAGKAIICGTATAGDGGTATAGYRGTATAGDGGTATAGDGGTATAGYRGTATAGEDGALMLRWWDGRKYRLAVFAVGENGVLPGTPYRLDAEGNAVAVQP